MSDKALFVMDMPECCDICNFSSTAYDSELFEEGECYCILKIKSVDDIVEGCKPDWCPLKPVPEKKPVVLDALDSFGNGWNECINKILEGCKDG